MLLVARERIPGLPFQLVKATVKVRANAVVEGSGKDSSQGAARTKAIREALERYSFRVPAGLFRALPGTAAFAVSPRQIVRYSKRQYSRTRFRFRPLSPDRTYLWKEATEIFSGEQLAVMAECVFSRRSLGREYSAHTYTSVTSSGMATDPRIDVAMHRALLELIERDAFMRHWMAQRGGSEIDRQSLPRRQQERIERLERAGCRISIQRLPTNFAYVVLVIIEHEWRHFTCLGSAANLDPGEALEHAMREAEVMAYFRLETPRAPRIHPRRVRKPEDHSNLYAQPEYFRKVDRLFLTEDQTKLPATPPKLLPKSPDKLVTRLRDRFGRVFCVDMTVPGVHEKFGNLKTVRAIVPGLIPLTFGYGTLPLGMVSRYHPRCLFPHPFA